MERKNGLINLISGDDALQAIDIVRQMAVENDVDWAVCGGIAMAIYGSPRLTKDVDIIASKRLPLESERIIGHLKQGGEHFMVATENREVPIDWILRNDDFKAFYREALKDAVIIDNIPILTPEWLVILKFIAGRFKDQEDAIYLLREKGLVNRDKIRELIIKVFGANAWLLAKSGYQRWFDLADENIEQATDGLRDS
jgi:hypothetical protein